MKPDEFVKSFDFLVEAAMTWTDCVKDPSKTFNTILNENTGKDAIKKTIKIWLTAFLFTLFLQGWAYQSHGIPLNSIEFHLSSALFVLASIVAVALSIQKAFGFFKLAIPSTDTFVAYTVYISAVSPFIGILATPQLAQILDILKEIKASGIEFEAAILPFFSQLAMRQDSTMSLISAAFSIPIMLISILQLVRCLKSLSIRSGAEKLKVFDAAAFGLVLAIIPVTVLSLIQMLLIYSML